MKGFYLGAGLFVLSMVFFIFFAYVNSHDKNIIIDSILAGLFLTLAGVLFAFATYFTVSAYLKIIFYYGTFK